MIVCTQQTLYLQESFDDYDHHFHLPGGTNGMELYIYFLGVSKSSIGNNNKSDKYMN